MHVMETQWWAVFQELIHMYMEEEKLEDRVLIVLPTVVDAVRQSCAKHF